ncbi:hypothetical protein OIU76_009033 [Salix suchowensis]|nr:hypothetical protein OIU76_009033 [Salix suchowensis]
MDHLIRQDRLKSRGEECLKRRDHYSASNEPIMEPANGKDQAVKWTVPSTGEHSSLQLQNSLDRTMEKGGWLLISYFRKNKRDSKLLFSRKYCVGRGGAVNLLVKVNKAFMMQYFSILKV